MSNHIQKLNKNIKNIFTDKENKISLNKEFHNY